MIPTDGTEPGKTDFTRPAGGGEDSGDRVDSGADPAKAGVRLSSLALLLDVQALDLTADQLAYRRRELPERAEVAEIDRLGTGLSKQLAALRAERDDLSARQDRLDQQVETMTSRIAAINARLNSGAASSFRDQEAMANESASLERHRRALEDQEIEIMEALEPVESELTALGAELSSRAATRANVASALAAAERALDDERAAVVAERGSLATGLPADLAATYERLRAKLGVGAARLVDGMCSGCHLRLPARERDLIQHAPDGTVFYCEQCGRILVP